MSVREVSDEEILNFLRANWRSYSSQMSLLQATVQDLWPEGAPPEFGERVVRLCLMQNNQATPLESGHILPASPTK